MTSNTINPSELKISKELLLYNLHIETFIKYADFAYMKPFKANSIKLNFVYRQSKRKMSQLTQPQLWTIENMKDKIEQG